MFPRTRQSRDATLAHVEQTIRLLRSAMDGLAPQKGVGSERAVAALESLVRDYERVRDSLHGLV